MRRAYFSLFSSCIAVYFLFQPQIYDVFMRKTVGHAAFVAPIVVCSRYFV